MKKIVKLGLVALMSATIGLSACNIASKKNKLEIEYLLVGKWFENDKVIAKVGEENAYEGDIESIYFFNLSTNTWTEAEFKTSMPTKDSLPIVISRTIREIPYDKVPGSPKGATMIVIDYDKGEEYARGEFGGKRSLEFQEETLKNAKEWAENMKKYFETKYSEEKILKKESEGSLIPEWVLHDDKAVEIKGQIKGIHSETEDYEISKQLLLQYISLRLEDGTYAHCWLPKNSKHSKNELEKEFHKDFLEKIKDFETAMVYELNEQNIDNSKAFFGDRDWVLGNYKLSDKISDHTNRWFQGKHYLIKEFQINGKTFNFE